MRVKPANWKITAMTYRLALVAVSCYSLSLAGCGGGGSGAGGVGTTACSSLWEQVTSVYPDATAVS